MVPLVSCFWADELPIQLKQKPATHHNGSNVNEEGTIRTRLLPVNIPEMRLKV